VTQAHESATSGSHQCVRADAALVRAFQFLGKRWNAAVLGALSFGPAGFRELSRSIVGIRDSVLSNRLASLAATGLISRSVDAGPPVSVTYALTERGEARTRGFRGCPDFRTTTPFRGRSSPSKAGGG